LSDEARIHLTLSQLHIIGQLIEKELERTKAALKQKPTDSKTSEFRKAYVVELEQLMSKVISQIG
jgi:hypothetical protein